MTTPHRTCAARRAAASDAAAADALVGAAQGARGVVVAHLLKEGISGG